MAYLQPREGAARQSAEVMDEVDNRALVTMQGAGTLRTSNTPKRPKACACTNTETNTG